MDYSWTFSRIDQMIIKVIEISYQDQIIFYTAIMQTENITLGKVAFQYRTLFLYCIGLGCNPNPNPSQTQMDLMPLNNVLLL